MAKPITAGSDVTNGRTSETYQSAGGGGTFNFHLNYTSLDGRFVAQVRYESGELAGNSFLVSQNDQHVTSITTTVSGEEDSKTILLTNHHVSQEITIVGGNVDHAVTHLELG
jgi:VCBS repeat-containing protein